MLGKGMIGCFVDYLKNLYLL